MGQGVGALKKKGGGMEPPCELWPTMGFTKFYGKSAVRIFPIFSCKVTGAYKLKTDLNYSFGEKSCFEVVWVKTVTKWAQNLVFKSYEESMHGASDFLHEIKATERLKID